MLSTGGREAAAAGEKFSRNFPLSGVIPASGKASPITVSKFSHAN